MPSIKPNEQKPIKCALRQWHINRGESLSPVKLRSEVAYNRDAIRAARAAQIPQLESYQAGREVRFGEHYANADFGAEGERFIWDFAEYTESGWLLESVNPAATTKRKTYERIARAYQALLKLEFKVADVYIISATKTVALPWIQSESCLNRIHEALLEEDTLRLAEYFDGEESGSESNHDITATIGKHCLKWDCQKQPECWSQIARPCVYDLPHLSSAQQQYFAENHLLSFEQAQQSGQLTKRQLGLIECYQNRHDQIDYAAIKEWFAHLVYPLNFLDFEAASPAIPLTPDVAGFKKLLFQFSCHHQSEAGLSHTEFLTVDLEDVHRRIAQKLLACLKPGGSIIVWYAEFERSRINELAARVPELAKELKALVPRIVDLQQIFIHHYHDYRVLGSRSLKLNYLTILQDRDYPDAFDSGADAVSAWYRLRALSSRSDRQQEFEALEAKLRDYCRMDTYALLQLNDYLKQGLINSSISP